MPELRRDLAAQVVHAQLAHRNCLLAQGDG